MNVYLNTGQTRSANIHLFNQSIAAKNSNNVTGESSKTGRRDSVSISPQGKKNSLLENLMSQKTRITEQKNSLISSTLEKGGTLDTIKSQLENYDEQMKSVNEQIAGIMAEEMEKQAEELKKPEDSKPKTEEQIQNERLAGLTRLSVQLDQTQKIGSVKARLDGDARVLKSEIELDKHSAGASPAARERIANKEETLAAMQQRSSDLIADISEKSTDITGKLN